MLGSILTSICKHRGMALMLTHFPWDAPQKALFFFSLLLSYCKSSPRQQFLWFPFYTCWVEEGRTFDPSLHFLVFAHHPLVSFGSHYQRKQTLKEAVAPKIDGFLLGSVHMLCGPLIARSRGTYSCELPAWKRNKLLRTLAYILLHQCLCTTLVLIERQNDENFTRIRHHW